MRISKSFLLLAGFAALVACDESVSNSDSGEVLNMPTVQDGDELGACNDSTIASIVYVADSAKVFFCDGRDWRDLNGVDGKDGEDGRDGKDGKDGIDGVDGYSGNSCSAVLDSNLVYTIVCVSMWTKIVLWCLSAAQILPWCAWARWALPLNHAL